MSFSNLAQGGDPAANAQPPVPGPQAESSSSNSSVSGEANARIMMHAPSLAGPGEQQVRLGPGGAGNLPPAAGPASSSGGPASAFTMVDMSPMVDGGGGEEGGLQHQDFHPAAHQAHLIAAQSQDPALMAGTMNNPQVHLGAPGPLHAPSAGSNITSLPLRQRAGSGFPPGNAHQQQQQQQQQQTQQQQQPQHQHQHQHQQQQEQQQQPESISSYFSQLLAENPELRNMSGALEKYIPFLILLMIKLLFDHGTGIAVFFCLLLTFFHANSVVRAQVQRQGRRNIWALLAVFVNLTACILFIYFVFPDDKLYNCALFMTPPKVTSLYDLIWLVGVNDFILKFVAVILKIWLIVVPTQVLAYQKRGKYFLVVERFFQLWRELAPIQVWLVYLLNGYEKIPGKVIGVILVAAYMVAKGKFLLRSAKAMKVAGEKMCQSTSYGRSPSREQLKGVGEHCPICYDSFRVPTMLHCKHIFCEECLATWFDRERTCPLCRAQVTEDPEWRDGSTSQFIQLF